MNIFKIQKATKKFHQKVVFHNLNFSVPDRGITCILGRNGAGKTTMIKCMLRLLNLNDGTILFHEKPIHTYKESIYYKKVSAVLEGNRNVYWYMSGWENILYFGRQKGLTDETIKNEAEKLLKMFSLYQAKDQKVGTYSRGMQQKLAIIIALLAKPEVLFLDEPTLGLDYASKNTMVEILAKLSENIPIILTSHQMDVVEKLCNKLVLIHEGGIVYEGDTETFRKKGITKPCYTIHVSNFSNALPQLNIQDIHQEEGITQFKFYPDDNLNLQTLIATLTTNHSEILNIERTEPSFEDTLMEFFRSESC